MKLILVILLISITSATNTTTNKDTTETDDDAKPILSPLVYVTVGIAIIFLLIGVSTCVYNVVIQKDPRSTVVKNPESAPGTCMSEVPN